MNEMSPNSITFIDAWTAVVRLPYERPLPLSVVMVIILLQ